MSKKLTTEEFIEKARKVHGDKYNYSKVEYVNSNVKVCIICTEHGEFWQTPSSHLQSRACPKCSYIERSINLKNSGEDFIKKAIEKHGNKYDYSKTKYVDCETEVTIICPEHGEFEMKPKYHINGSGCPLCSEISKTGKHSIRKDTKTFVQELKEIYGDRLDYSEIVYINAKTNVWITDKELNYRYQITPTKLLSRGLRKTIETSEKDFISESKEIHGDRYDYSRVDFKGMYTKVCIVCPEHGEFWQTPHNHLTGYGCEKCGKNRCGEKLKSNKEDFVNKANKIHNNTYTYNNFNYINCKTKSYITCPIHGDFLQTPGKHLRGHGCPICGESNLEKEIRLYLEAKNIQYIKEYSTEWLKNGKGLLKIDFYLPEYGVFMECQGIQHFVVPNFKYKTNLNKILERDERKFKRVSEHGYRILYYTTEDNFKYRNISNIYDNNLYTNIDDLFKHLK